MRGMNVRCGKQNEKEEVIWSSIKYAPIKPTASSEGKQNCRGFAFARREVLLSTREKRNPIYIYRTKVATLFFAGIDMLHTDYSSNCSRPLWVIQTHAFLSRSDILIDPGSSVSDPKSLDSRKAFVRVSTESAQKGASA